MAFTKHGHYIPGSINRGGPTPNQVVDCGGFKLCPFCKTELEDSRKESIRLGQEWTLYGGPKFKEPEEGTIEKYFQNFAELLDEVIEKPQLKKLLLAEVEFLRNAVKNQDK